ncbi:MAG: fused MFS/spermidine synthase [Candidatus Eisenbacteria bacterium]|nr:fused MFS/spermidine synthase [Candidatus Eisenbacteria bacterium]
MQRTPVPKRLILVFFFLSGVAGLIYEVVWARLLERVMGASVYSITTVLTVYMAGLALGSFLAGRFVDRRSDTLRIYGLLQGAIGIYCLLVPAIIAATMPLYRAAYQNLAGLAHSWSAVRFLVSGLVLIVPTTLMGATLPVLSRHLTKRYDSLGETVGQLYAVNSLGAVVGAFGAGFVLMPLLGMWGTILSAAVANIVIAVAAVALHHRGGGARERRAPKPKGGERAAKIVKVEARQPAHGHAVHSDRVLAFVLAAFALSGFAAMVYQVAWMRTLSLVLGSSVYAVSITLTAYVLGLTIGAAVFARLVDRNRDLLLLFGWIEIGVGAAALGVVPILGRLPIAMIAVIEDYSGSFPLLMAVEFLIVFLLVLAPTVLLGGVFPTVVKLFTKRVETVGRSVGSAYASNTLGAIAGSFAGGFVLIPWIGIQRSIAVAVVVNVALGSALALASPSASRFRKLAAPAAAILTLVLFLPRVPRWDPVIMSSGAYLYADMYARQAQAWNMSREDVLRHSGEILYHKEGVATTVTVRRVRNELFLQANGKTEASTGPDMKTQRLLGHVPMMLHPDPKSALVIGLASGVTVGSVATYPVERIDCVEIAPAMVEVARTFFAEANRHCLDDPRVSVIIEDGRNHVAFTDRVYDVIISEPPNPWVSGVSNLLTREFLELAKARTAPGGVVGIWFQAYNMSPGEFRMMARTFASVFEHATLWEIDPAVDYMFVGTVGRPALVDHGTVARRLADPLIGDDLASIRVRTVADWSGLFVTGGEALVRYAGAGPLHTDDGLQLEFSTPRNMYRQWKGEQLEALDAFRIDPGALLAGLPQGEAGAIADAVTRRASARRLVAIGLAAAEAGRTEDEYAAYRAAASESPDDPVVAEAVSRLLCRMGAELLANNRAEESMPYLLASIEAGPDFAQPRYFLGAALLRLRRIDEARGELERALEIDPSYADAYFSVAAVYEALGMKREQLRALERYVESAPTASNVAAVRARVERLRLESGKEGARP